MYREKPTRRILRWPPDSLALAAHRDEHLGRASHRPRFTRAATRRESGRSSRHATPILSAPALPVGPAPAASPASPATSPATSTTGSTVPATPITVVLPPAPGPAPAKADAATQVAVPAGNKSNGGGSAKKPTTGVAAGGGCPAGRAMSGTPTSRTRVYSMINSERAANSLPALGRSGQLNSSAGAHNVAMADTNDFDHQVACESDLGPGSARPATTGPRSARTSPGAATPRCRSPSRSRRRCTTSRRISPTTGQHPLDQLPQRRRRRDHRQHRQDVDHLRLRQLGPRGGG